MTEPKPVYDVDDVVTDTDMQEQSERDAMAFMSRRRGAVRDDGEVTDVDDQQELVSLIGSLRQDNERLTMDSQAKDALVERLRNELVATAKVIQAIRLMLEAFVR